MSDVAINLGVVAVLVIAWLLARPRRKKPTPGGVGGR